MVGEWSTVGVGKVPTQEEFEESQEDDAHLDKMVVNVG